MPERNVIGWDGGAHVKAARLQGGAVVDATQWPCPLWQGLDQLERVLSLAAARWPDLAAQRHAVTMTGEMVDLFAHREDGVQRIAALLDRALPSPRFFAGDASWPAAHEAGPMWEAIASANWLVTKAQPIINSTSAEPERLEKVPLVAKRYNTRLIALTMGASGIPVAADERVNIALEKLIPRMMEIDFPIQDLIIDPLVLTVSGCQEYGPQLIEAVRTLQYAWDPPPAISCWPFQRLQRGAARKPTIDQPGICRHVDGSRPGSQ